jgi:hypothetical protein
MSCLIALVTRWTSSGSVGLRIGASGQRALKLAITTATSIPAE